MAGSYALRRCGYCGPADLHVTALRHTTTPRRPPCPSHSTTTTRSFQPAATAGIFVPSRALGRLRVWDQKPIALQGCPDYIAPDHGGSADQGNVEGTPLSME